MNAYFLFSIILLFSCISTLNAQEPPRVIHVFVALCDNKYQGIIPVPKTLGNGDNPNTNLYWGALYGIKSFFRQRKSWSLIKNYHVSNIILERVIFKHKTKNIFLIADAYRGREIKQTTIDFLNAASGHSKGRLYLNINQSVKELKFYGYSNLIVYIGHNGLMDFTLTNIPTKKNNKQREIVILACKSKPFFREAIIRTGAKPLLWTTGFMAPEAYTLKSAIDGWILKEPDTAIARRAAKAYATYQKCRIKSAIRLLKTGF